jgi:tetratricopeptide (TPR) repeat protein
MMKTIFADFNAMTEADHVCLTTRGSQEDIQQAGIQPGDWAWLSDGELVVGAKLAVDPHYGLVGIPAWDTLVHLDTDEARDFNRLVHLDTDEARDFNRVWQELQPLIQNATESSEDQSRIYGLFTQLERVAPPHVVDAGRGYFALRRAVALRHLGQFGLALLEIEAARRFQPDNPVAIFLYLDLLGRENLPRAVVEAETFATSTNAPAVVLAAGINILATLADETPDEGFQAIADRLLDWCGRFEHAPDLRQVAPSLVALSYFNRGLGLLRLGQTTEARQAFQRAHETFPFDPSFDEATRLNAYDQHARDVAQRVRKAARPLAA